MFSLVINLALFMPLVENAYHRSITPKSLHKIHAIFIQDEVYSWPSEKLALVPF